MPQNDPDGKPIIWMHVPLAYPYDPDYDHKFFPDSVVTILDAHERAVAAAQYEIENNLFDAQEIYDYHCENLKVQFTVDYKE